MDSMDVTISCEGVDSRMIGEMQKKEGEIVCEYVYKKNSVSKRIVCVFCACRKKRRE
jgi:hypothetical protein